MKLYLAILCTFIGGAEAIAQDKMQGITSQVIKKRENKMLKRSFDFSVGFIDESIQSEDDLGEYKTNGFELQGGWIFNINKKFSLTSGLLLNRRGVNGSDAEGEDTTIQEIGVTQRASFNYIKKYVTFRPFVELGISRGRVRTTGDIAIFDQEIEYEIRTNFNKFSGALGLQAVFNNGIVPFIKYSYSRLNISDKTEVEFISNGSSQTIDDNNIERTLDPTAKAIVIGIGYMY